MLWPADEDLIKRDRSLGRALALLLDEEAFVAALQARLRNVTINSARAVYLRYKPQTNCLVAYRMNVDGKELDVYAKGYRSGDCMKLDTEDGDRISGAESERALALRDQAVVVFFFPHDRELKALKRLNEGEPRKKLLRKLLPDRSHLWSGRIEMLRYKPGRRFAAHLSTETLADGALIKIYSPSEFRSASAAAAFRSRGVMRVARLLGVHQRHRMLAFEWISGQPLGDLLRKSASPSTIELVGEALAELHAQPLTGLRHRTSQTVQRSMSEITRGLETLAPLESKRAALFAQEIGRRLAKNSMETRSVHGDFYENQVLVTDEGVALLDLDQAACGDPTSDLGTFLAHLEQEVLFGSINAVRLAEVRRALPAGYERASGLFIAPDELAIHTAAALMLLAHDPFRYRQPDWPTQTAAILDRVGQLLNHQPANKSGRKAAPASAHAFYLRVHKTDPFGAAEDSAMPFLQHALDPMRVLSKLRDCLGRYAGVKNVDLHEIRVTRHKHGRRCVVEYDVSFKSAGGCEELVTLVGKARARGLDETSARRLFDLRRAGFDENSSDGISVPEPLGVIPEFQMWLQRKVPGGRAGESLAGVGGVRLAEQIGRAIHKLQHAGVVPDRQHTLKDELNILRRRLSLVCAAKPQWRGRLQNLMAACEQAARSLPSGQILPAHRDFYPDQLIVNGERLYLLDLDLFASADDALDAGNFIAHLTEQSLRLTGDANALADCEHALEESLVVRSNAEISRASIRAFATLTLVRHIYISTLLADRRELTESILELCERRLDASRRKRATELPVLLPLGGICHVNTFS